MERLRSRSDENGKAGFIASFVLPAKKASHIRLLETHSFLRENIVFADGGIASRKYSKRNVPNVFLRIFTERHPESSVNDKVYQGFATAFFVYRKSTYS